MAGLLDNLARHEESRLNSFFDAPEFRRLPMETQRFLALLAQRRFNPPQRMDHQSSNAQPQFPTTRDAMAVDPLSFGVQGPWTFVDRKLPRVDPYQALWAWRRALAHDRHGRDL